MSEDTFVQEQVFREGFRMDGNVLVRGLVCKHHTRPRRMDFRLDVRKQIAQLSFVVIGSDSHVELTNLSKRPFLLR